METYKQIMFFVIMAIGIYNLWTWPEAVRDLQSGGARGFFAVMGFPFRVFVLLGCLGILIGGDLTESVFGCTPIDALYY